MNISVLSIIIVVLITAAVTIIFPENKYKNHLMLMTKIIVVVSIITAFVKSEMNFDFSAKYDQSVGDYGVISSVHDEIKNNIKEYVEAAFDTKCNIEINEKSSICSSKASSLLSGWRKSGLPVSRGVCPFMAGTYMPS